MTSFCCRFSLTFEEENGHQVYQTENFRNRILEQICQNDIVQISHNYFLLKWKNCKKKSVHNTFTYCIYISLETKKDFKCSSMLFYCWTPISQLPKSILSILDTWYDFFIIKWLILLVATVRTTVSNIIHIRTFQCTNNSISSISIWTQIK